MSDTLIRGTAVALPATGIDTDQILPARFLSRLEKTGFHDALFCEWRKDPGFVLNAPHAADAQLLIGGRDFGIGSSREHAVWALQDWGFRAVFGPSFGDIFMTNAGECGFLVGVVTEEDQQRLVDAHADGSTAFTVSVRSQEIRWDGGTVPFTVEARSKRLLLSGGDAIGHTLRFEDALSAYEERRSPFLPTVG